MIIKISVKKTISLRKSALKKKVVVFSYESNERFQHVHELTRPIVISLLFPFRNISNKEHRRIRCCKGKLSFPSAAKELEVPYTLFMTCISCFKFTFFTALHFLGDFLGLPVLEPVK